VLKDERQDERRHYRADGWPLCPLCEEDELWTAAHSPDLEDHFLETFRCYRCGWSGRRVMRKEKHD
jgi:hypothetical protein